MLSVDCRFAVIAAGQDAEDPAESYKVDLFTGERQAGHDPALSYVRFASAINRMSGIAFFAHYGETSRIVGFFPEPADTVASRIFDLHRRHAANVCRVFEGVIRSHAASLREGSLPADCLLSLVLAQREDGDVYPAPNTVTEPAVNVGQNIRIAIDAKLRRVHFDRWGVIEGASATPIITLP